MNADFPMLLRLLQERRSIRNFLPDPVPEAMLEQILQAASWAPSAGNRQAYRFLVARQEDTRRAMARAVRERIAGLKADLREDTRELAVSYLDNFTHFEKAPLALVPIYRAGPDLLQAASSGHQLDRGSRALADSLSSVSAAIMNLLLAAQALGLGACWMTGPLLARDDLEDLLKVPKGWTMAAVIPVGYPAETPQAPRRREVSRLFKLVD